MNRGQISKIIIGIFVTTLLLATAVGCGTETVAEQESGVDLVFYNGVVYTVDGDFSVAQAVAIDKGKIVAIGSDDDLKSYMDEADATVDLEGKTLIPGLIDSHAHLFSYARSLSILNLVGTESVEEIAKMVAAKAAEVEPGEWILGRGWDQNDWRVKAFPTHHPISRAAPDNPVMLTRVDGHALWANAKAMEIAGVTKDTADPDGGEIIRDDYKRPTGVFVDNAEDLISDHVPEMAKEKKKELLQQAVANCLADGLTGSHEMGGSPSSVEIVRELIDEGKFPYRLYFFYSANLDNLDELMAEGHQNYGDSRLIIRSVKAYADGALGSRGAALLAPYSDRPDSSGLIITSKDDLRDLTERCLKAGFQVGTHAIGDRANRIVLDAYQEALEATGVKGARLRIEHAQVISPEDIPRFKELDVLPCMQPTHCTSDLPWALDRLGEERIKGAYAWRSLLDTGVIIPGGSDFPVEDINPIWGFYAAVTRKHKDGTPEGGYYPEQKMTREEALKAFTIWAAYAGFMENEIGSIEVGKKADLVVLDQNIMEVPEDQILATKVVTTVLGGKIVYNKDGE